MILNGVSGGWLELTEDEIRKNFLLFIDVDPDEGPPIDGTVTYGVYDPRTRERLFLENNSEQTFGRKKTPHEDPKMVDKDEFKTPYGESPMKDTKESGWS